MTFLQKMLLVLIVLGGMLVFHGFQEKKLAGLSQSVPQRVELSALEQGQALSNAHIVIGDHWALFPYSIYQYNTSKYSHKEPTDSTKLDFALVPLISRDHPYYQGIKALQKKYSGEEDTIPEDEWPPFRDFKVLLKTSQYATLGDLPVYWEEVSNVQGLVINEIDKLSGEELRLIQETWPALDVEHVLILEQGRKPKSMGMVWLMIGGGIVMVVVFLLFFLISLAGGKTETKA